jgi:hypothetical protein
VKLCYDGREQIHLGVVFSTVLNRFSTCPPRNRFISKQNKTDSFAARMHSLYRITSVDLVQQLLKAYGYLHVYGIT